MRDINAISAVDFKEFGLKEKEPRVNILTSVEEKKPYYFQTAIGYDTSQHRYVNAKIGDRNLFGLNKEAWISQELSDIGHRTETGVTEPRFLGTKISATVNLYAEKLAELNKNYGNVTYGSTLNLSREYSSHVTSALAFTYKFTDKYMKDGTEVSDEEKNTNDGRHMFITSPSISYNTTDSFIRPKKGIYSIFSVDFSSALGNKYDDFLRYQLQARYYYSPISFLTLALRARYGYLKPIAVDGIIPDDQLFYLGGATDVRGFDENLLRFDSEGSPVGGREFFMGSVETRIDLGLNLEMTCFYDAGRVGRTNSGEGDGGVRAAVGTGLRYVTPIGPVGFLYGWKIARKPGEASGNLHFTIGYSF
jgi:outer membrane protein insertion porin family